MSSIGRNTGNINLPASEQAELIRTVETVGQDVVKRKPDPFLRSPIFCFAAAAKRTK